MMMYQAEYHRNWYLKNRDKIQAKYRLDAIGINDRRRQKPSSILATIRRNARYRNETFSLTPKSFADWYNSQEKVCCYCDIPIERLAISDKGKKLSKRLSVDRIDNDKGYEIDNIALSCLKCNFIKSNILTAQEMREIGQKYFKPKWQSEKLE